MVLGVLWEFFQRFVATSQQIVNINRGYSCTVHPFTVYSYMTEALKCSHYVCLLLNHLHLLSYFHDLFDFNKFLQQCYSRSVNQSSV